ncbi:MAG TPA: DUF6516 family protein [Acetobacteraceae bacterium]|nr:DUF6516 family protein [Acetobacteraceae bacterium]
MPKAEKLLDIRLETDDGFLIALWLWRVPQPVRPARHSFKYALFFGRPGKRLVLFDNERGKGDHKHILGVESSYEFSTPEKLIADFEAAVRAMREGDKG